MEPRIEGAHFKHASHSCSHLPPLNFKDAKILLLKILPSFLLPVIPSEKRQGKQRSSPDVRREKSFAVEVLAGPSFKQEEGLG